MRRDLAGGAPGGAGTRLEDLPLGTGRTTVPPAYLNPTNKSRRCHQFRKPWADQMR